MKRLLRLAIMVGLLALLGACGSETSAGDTNNSKEETALETEKETAETTTVKPELEIVQSTGGAWKDSIDTVWVHSAAIFENTGDVPVEIGETQLNYKDAEGGILGTSTMIYAVPSIVAPGEQAYIAESTTLEGITDPKEYKETTHNFNFDPTESEANLLKVSGIKGIPGKDEYSIPYTVTGVVTNTTEELQEDIRIAAALLTKDGTLLGILTGSVDVGVNPGSEAGFELSYPEVPKEVIDKVSTVDVKAFGWTW